MNVPTRSKLRDAAQTCRDAGGSTTQMLHTIARVLTVSTGTHPEFKSHLASVLDMAGFYYDELSTQYERKTGATPYPPETVTFDDLTGDDQAWIIERVVNEFGELDGPPEPPAPIALADHLLDGLRKAAALKVEHGGDFAEVYYRVENALFALLLTQSVEWNLVAKCIEHALTTGKPIAEAVAFVDGQL